MVVLSPSWQLPIKQDHAEHEVVSFIYSNGCNGCEERSKQLDVPCHTVPPPQKQGSTVVLKGASEVEKKYNYEVHNL